MSQQFMPPQGQPLHFDPPPNPSATSDPGQFPPPSASTPQHFSPPPGASSSQYGTPSSQFGQGQQLFPLPPGPAPPNLGNFAAPPGAADPFASLSLHDGQPASPAGKSNASGQALPQIFTPPSAPQQNVQSNGAHKPEFTSFVSPSSNAIPPPQAQANASSNYTISPPTSAIQQRQSEKTDPRLARLPTLSTKLSAGLGPQTAIPSLQSQGLGVPNQQERPPMTPSPFSAYPGATGGPPQAQFVGAATTRESSGRFNGGSYLISHRDTNTVLTLQLAVGCPIHAKPGVMIAMSHSIHLKGQVKVTFKKIISGGELRDSTFTGPGELLLAPHGLGDIAALVLDGKSTWSVGKDAFLAATSSVVKEYKSQGFGKMVFSGEGLFVYRISGHGILWMSSMGAIIKRDLKQDERYIVDTGHLVAWSASYVLERAASGGVISGIASGEGLVCKFTGPGAVYLQSRNPLAVAAYLGGVTPSA